MLRESIFLRATGVVSLAALVACSNGTSASPVGAILDRSTQGRAVGPSGLEQQLVTKVNAASAGSPYTAMLTATSTLVNTGAAPVHVKARTCLVQEPDVESTAQMDRFEPMISCAADHLEVDLAPGQSLGPLEVQFGVRSGPGTYTLKVRHALAPELRAEAVFRVP